MTLRIHSNFSALGSQLQGNPRFEHVYIGESVSFVGDLRLLWRARRSADFLLLNIDHKRLALACAVFGIFSPRPFRRCRLVSVDLLLRPPNSVRAWIINRLKSFLYRQIDLFVLYFRNIDGYVRHFRIRRERTVYVPFKVNNWQILKEKRSEPEVGQYVLLSGATLRDHATYIEAVRRAGVPAILLLPGNSHVQIQNCPPNLRVEFHTDGKEETYIRYMQEARLVCFPRFKWDIASSGISGYLCAMALGKFVAISRGPGAEEVLAEDDAAAFFEPGDVGALAQIIRKAWDDPEYCRRIASNGAKYAETLQGEERMLRDIVNKLAEFARERS